jgi:hypothetical protein
MKKERLLQIEIGDYVALVTALGPKLTVAGFDQSHSNN